MPRRRVIWDREMIHQAFEQGEDCTMGFIAGYIRMIGEIGEMLMDWLNLLSGVESNSCTVLGMVVGRSS